MKKGAGESDQILLLFEVIFIVIVLVTCLAPHNTDRATNYEQLDRELKILTLHYGGQAVEDFQQTDKKARKIIPERSLT